MANDVRRCGVPCARGPRRDWCRLGGPGHDREGPGDLPESERADGGRRAQARALVGEVLRQLARLLLMLRKPPSFTREIALLFMCLEASEFEKQND